VEGKVIVAKSIPNQSNSDEFEQLTRIERIFLQSGPFGTKFAKQASWF
jgi:hypothetical protein